MKTEAIWRIAAEVRRQAAFAPAWRQLDPQAAIDRTRRLAVNGVAFDVIWDIAEGVHDEHGREVMGVCEHDAEEPDQVMISLNRGIVGERPDLLRSTTGHELGHAVFDMPAAVQGERQLRLNLGDGPVARRAFRIVSRGPRRAQLGRDRLSGALASGGTTDFSPCLGPRGLRGFRCDHRSQGQLRRALA